MDKHLSSAATLASRYHDITQRIEDAHRKTLLGAPHVTLVAVAKSHSAEAILPLLQAGHRVFGENKVQEAEGKWLLLREQFPDTELHLIGSLQSNKAREALKLFDVIETVDRPSLVDALVKERARGHPLQCSRFFIQVNIGEEKQKGGVSPREFPELLAYCKTRELPVGGLMCVPPSEKNPAPYFALLHTLAKEYQLADLSMGMSDDYETAIRFGATYVRVGTALFGQRV